MRRPRSNGEYERAYFKGLSVPVCHSLYAGHVREAIGKLAQLLHAVCEANGQFLGEELGSAKHGAWMEEWSQRTWLAAGLGLLLSPTLGRSPNWTICRKLTPVAGKLL